MVMNENLSVAPARSATPAIEPARQPLDREALIAALAGIRADSQRNPANYLDDTVVPSGGE
jgi:hypothetical protein